MKQVNDFQLSINNQNQSKQRKVGAHLNVFTTFKEVKEQLGRAGYIADDIIATQIGLLLM